MNNLEVTQRLCFERSFGGTRPNEKNRLSLSQGAAGIDELLPRSGEIIQVDAGEVIESA